MHKEPNLAQLSTQARPGARMATRTARTGAVLQAAMAVSWPWPSAVSEGPALCHSAPMTVSWACARRVLGVVAPCVVRDPSSLPLAQPQYTLVYCDTPPASSSHCPSCCVTIQFLCIKTQSLSLLAFLLQYSLCLAIQSLAKPTPLAIQFLA